MQKQKDGGKAPTSCSSLNSFLPGLIKTVLENLPSPASA